jgi:Flp pilus assembly protein TadD
MTTATPTTLSQLKDQGNQLCRQKDYANAITKFTEAIELDGSSNAILFTNRAACYLGLKKYEPRGLSAFSQPLTSPLERYQQGLEDA